MDSDKKARILQAAIKIFSRKGYQYATVAEIASEAGVSKGLVHVYFESKIDILLDVILQFMESLNQLIEDKLVHIASPVSRLHAVFESFQEIMAAGNRDLYWGHLMKEGLPDSEALKEGKPREKFSRIGPLIRKLQATLDTIITEGQRAGCIDSSHKPQVIRQMLGGASQLLFQGLAMENHGRAAAGYDAADVHRAMRSLIDKFTVNKQRPEGIRPNNTERS